MLEKWELLLLPKIWVHLLLGVEPTDTNKPKIERRKDLLLAASKENTGDLSQSSVSPNSKFREFFFFNKFILFIYLVLAVLGLRSCAVFL